MSQTITASQFLATQFPRPAGAPLKNEEKIRDFVDSVLDHTELSFRPRSNCLSIEDPRPINSSEQAIRVLRQGILISDKDENLTIGYDSKQEVLTCQSRYPEIAKGTVIDLSA